MVGKRGSGVRREAAGGRGRLGPDPKWSGLGGSGGEEGERGQTQSSGRERGNWVGPKAGGRGKNGVGLETAGGDRGSGRGRGVMDKEWWGGCGYNGAGPGATVGGAGSDEKCGGEWGEGARCMVRPCCPAPPISLDGQFASTNNKTTTKLSWIHPFNNLRFQAFCFLMVLAEKPLAFTLVIKIKVKSILEKVAIINLIVDVAYTK